MMISFRQTGDVRGQRRVFLYSASGVLIGQVNLIENQKAAIVDMSDIPQGLVIAKIRIGNWEKAVKVPIAK